MSNLVQTKVFDGWDLDVADAEEPRVRDLDIATRAGLARPRDVRRIIDQNWDELTAHGEIRVCALCAQTSGGRPGREYWLNEAQSAALIAMLRTPMARELRIALVKLFVAYRRGQLAAPTTLALDIVHGPRVGDNDLLRSEVSNMCAAVAKASRLPLRRVHGWVRRTFKVPGIHHLGVAIWPTVKDLLFQIILGKLAITSIRRLPPADDRQLRLFQGGKA